MILALFDFDGTITKSDSLIKFIRFVVGDVKFFFGLIVLSPILVAFKIKLVPNYKAKEIMITWFFKGMSHETFLKVSSDYSLNEINRILRPKALKRIDWHKRQGHKVIVVSASSEFWLLPWCEDNGLDLIATKIEVKNGCITGKFIGENCYGEEKVNRLKEKFNFEEVKYIYGYGDSRGDKEMLSLANESYYKFFI
jgi:HAD superfamily hydrolase (TIGR01490 family)